MEQKKLTFDQIHIPIVLQDLLRNLWLIIMAGAIGCMSVFVYTGMIHEPAYTSEVTFAISPKSNGSYVGFYASLNTANQMAEVFKEVFSSDVLKRMVKEDLPDPSIPISVSAEVEEDTNILRISATADTPAKAHAVMKAVLANYGQVSDYLFGGVVLDTIKSPHVPMQVSNPVDVPLLLTAAILGAMVAMAGAVAYLSVTRDTVKTLASAKRSMDESPIGILVRENRFRKRKLMQYQKGLLITRASVSFRYVESVFQIAHKLSYRMKKSGQKVLLVTSVAENEGKSTVAANLAIALAKHGNRVALLDLDLRRPALHKLFSEGTVKWDLMRCVENGVVPEPGEKESVLVLTLNGPCKSPSTLLHSPQFADLMAKLREKMDYVILDSAPYIAVADTGIVLQHADSSVMVVRQDWVPSQVLKDISQELDQAKATYLGYIFNYYLEDGKDSVSHRYYDKYSYYGK